MILDSCNDATQLQRERSRADIALRANLERNAAIGEKIHECRIIYRSDAVAYPFGAEELDGLSNFFWAANFAGVDEPVKPQRRSLLVYRPQFLGGHAQLIAAKIASKLLSGRCLRSSMTPIEIVTSAYITRCDRSCSARSWVIRA